jgi:hypothetical protein
MRGTKVILGIVIGWTLACGDRADLVAPGDARAGIMKPPKVPPGPPADAGKPASIAFVDWVSETDPGGTLDLRVRVSDKKGIPLAGRPVLWSATEGGSFSATETTTDAAGEATTSFTAAALAAVQHVVTATSGTYSASASLTTADPNEVIGNSTVAILRADACGRADGRLCESLIGNIITDAMRAAHATDFALVNSGLIRDDLTCPAADETGDHCPPYTAPPYLITRGQVSDALPLGNRVATLQVNGSELKALLENGVSQLPAADGRFLQVSGLCFSYDIAATAGSRVYGAVRQAEDGSCTGPAVDFTTGTMYSIAASDFMTGGGDGYPDYSGRVALEAMLDQVVRDYVSASTPLSPAIQGRIGCTTTGAATCPAGSP